MRARLTLLLPMLALALWAWAPGMARAAAPGSAPPSTTKSPSGGATVVSDGPVAVSVTLSPDPSFIGDLLRLELVAAFPKGVSVNLPIGLSLAPIHLVDDEESAPETTGAGLRKKFILEVQCFETGEQHIPGFPVTWVGEAGDVHTLDIPPIAFRVDSLLANEADAEPARRDEDPPISRVYPNATAEIVIYSVLGTLVAALLIAVLARRYFGRVKPVYVPPPIPPHVVALEALDELEGGSLVEEGSFQTYYLQLTEIAKGYIEGRFGVMALDRTTEEIRREVMRSPKRVQPLDGDEVIDFLQRCDLVKFARFAPPKDEAEGELIGVRDMVVRSKPAEAKPEETACDGTEAPQSHDAQAPPAESGAASESPGEEAPQPEASDADAEAADAEATTADASPPVAPDPESTTPEPAEPSAPDTGEEEPRDG